MKFDLSWKYVTALAWASAAGLIVLGIGGYEKHGPSMAVAPAIAVFNAITSTLKLIETARRDPTEVANDKR